MRKGPGKITDHRVGRGKERGKGKRRGTESRWRKGRGRGREMVMGKVLLNKPQREMMCVVLSLCSCRRVCIRQTRTLRAN